MALTTAPLLYVLTGTLLSYLLYTRITLFLRRRQMKALHGCQPCPYQYNTDPLVGLNVFLENTRNSRNRCLLRNNRARFLKQRTNTFRSRMMHYSIIATIEPENIKTILSLKFGDYAFGMRKAAFTPLLGEGIFNSDGEKWANSRHLIRPNFAREQVADLADFERHFQLLLRHFPEEGETFDIQPLFFGYTIDSATEFLFNHCTDSLRRTEDVDENNEDAVFARAFNLAQEDMLDRVRWAFLDPLRPKTKANEAIRICHAYVGKIVDEAIQWRREREAAAAAGKKVEEDGRYVFIHELVKQTDDKERLRSEVINVLVAGRDTTASLMSNALFEIAKRPEIWKKMREEVAVLEGREPTYEELKGFKYIRWCLNECKLTTPTTLSFVERELTPFSPPPQPRSPHERSLRRPRHRPPPRRRPARQVPPLRQGRHCSRLLALRTPPTCRYLRARRGGVPARALGDAASGVGIHTVQWRTKDMSWAAICIDGGWVCDD
jgi:cytochrome P450